MPSVFEVARLELQKQKRKCLRDRALKAAAVARTARRNIDDVNTLADELLGIPDFHQQMMDLGCAVQCGGNNNIAMRHKGYSYTAHIYDAASLVAALQRFCLL